MQRVQASAHARDRDVKVDENSIRLALLSETRARWSSGMPKPGGISLNEAVLYSLISSNHPDGCHQQSCSIRPEQILSASSRNKTSGNVLPRTSAVALVTAAEWSWEVAKQTRSQQYGENSLYRRIRQRKPASVLIVYIVPPRSEYSHAFPRRECLGSAGYPKVVYPAPCGWAARTPHFVLNFGRQKALPAAGRDPGS